MFVEAVEEILEILDCHASRGAAAGDAGEVGRVEAKLVHPRFHPWRDIGLAPARRRYWQTTNRRHHARGFGRCFRRDV